MNLFQRLFLASRIILIATFCTAWTASGVEPDLTSPSAALKSLHRSIEAQDGTAVLKIFYAANDEERELSQAFTDLILGAKKLSDTEKTAFGITGEPPATGIMTRDELTRLDQAELKISGDTATILPLGRSRAIQFHRSKDRWQLVIRDFANAEENLPRQVSLLKKVTQVFESVAGEITSGKFATAQEAEAVIQTKLASVMIKAATQATSQPSIKPERQ